MAAAMQREYLLERRQETPNDTDKLWESLTLAQKFAASSLALLETSMILMWQY